MLRMQMDKLKHVLPLVALGAWIAPQARQSCWPQVLCERFHRNTRIV